MHHNSHSEENRNKAQPSTTENHNKAQSSTETHQHTPPSGCVCKADILVCSTTSHTHAIRPQCALLNKSCGAKMASIVQKSTHHHTCQCSLCLGDVPCCDRSCSQHTRSFFASTALTFGLYHRCRSSAKTLGSDQDWFILRVEKLRLIWGGNLHDFASQTVRIHVQKLASRNRAFLEAENWGRICTIP